MPGAARVAGDAERDAAPERQVGRGRCGAHARLPGHGSGSRYATSRGPGIPSRFAPPPETPPVVLPSCGLSSGRLKPSPFPALLLRSGLVRACKQGALPPPSGTGPYSDSGVGASLEPREGWSTGSGILCSGSQKDSTLGLTTKQCISSEFFLRPTWWPGSLGAFGKNLAVWRWGV